MQIFHRYVTGPENNNIFEIYNVYRCFNPKEDRIEEFSTGGDFGCCAGEKCGQCSSSESGYCFRTYPDYCMTIMS